MDFSPDKLRARFAELTKQYEASPIHKLKAERDKSFAKLNQAQRDDFDKRIRKANEGLYEIEQERAVIARALGGKTG